MAGVSRRAGLLDLLCRPRKVRRNPTTATEVIHRCYRVPAVWLLSVLARHGASTRHLGAMPEAGRDDRSRSLRDRAGVRQGGSPGRARLGKKPVGGYFVRWARANIGEPEFLIRREDVQCAVPEGPGSVKGTVAKLAHGWAQTTSGLTLSTAAVAAADAGRRSGAAHGLCATHGRITSFLRGKIQCLSPCYLSFLFDRRRYATLSCRGASRGSPRARRGAGCGP